MDLLNDRLAFVEQALKGEGVRRLKERAAYEELVCTELGLARFAELTEELIEDIEFDVRLSEGDKRSVIKSLREGMTNKDTAMLLAEVIKEEVLSELRDALDAAVAREQEVALKQEEGDKALKRVRHKEFELVERLQHLKVLLG